MNRSLIRWGFVLFLLSLATGFAVPMLKSPRLGLSAHSIGVMSGLMLIAVGVIWDKLNIGAAGRRVLYWLWVAMGVGNWAGTLAAAYFGGSQLMPIAGGGQTAAPAGEMLVTIVIIAVSVISVAAVSMVLWGLRGNGAETGGRSDD